MEIKDNKNFKKVELYNKNIPLSTILKTIKTQHLKEERLTRFERALTYLDEDDFIEHTFLVDKNHPSGKELHCVTHSGLIFILNERKLKENIPCLITVLLGRPNQVARLYQPFGLVVSNYTLEKCRYYINNNLNQ